MSDGTRNADVLINSPEAAEIEPSLVEALASVGFSAQTRVVAAQRGLEWLVLVAVPLQAFLNGVGEAFAKDACQALREGLRRIAGRGARRPGASPHPVVVQDVATGLQLLLEPDLPVDAYRALTPETLAGFTGGPIHYDRDRRRWRSTVDEAAAR